VRSGLLRHKITIQESTEVADGLGGFSVVWTDLFDARAAIWPLSAKESLDAMKLESVITSKIRIRYRDGITSKNRIKFGSRIFNIKGKPINPDERNKMLDILVLEDT